MKTIPTLNSRQIAFVDLVITGKPGGTAWEEAGYQARGNAADVQACRALKRPNIQAYLKSERERMAQAGRMTRDELVAFLTSVLRTPVGDVDEKSRLCQEFTIEEAGESVIRKRIKMVGKLEAAGLLVKVMGWNAPENIQLTASDQLADLIRRIRSSPSKGGSQ